VTTFLALVHDASRELNSRKLFWIVLALSAVFVIVYASIGFDDRGMFILFGLNHYPNELLVAGSPMARLLYRGIFATFVVPIWLAWIATILALISTAPIFPEFVAGGSIDLVLCKPIGRLKLFLYKYAASLLFMLLQVSVFCVGVFLAIGWRLGEWEWRVLAAIPIVTLFYSYLYSFCVFVGVWSRSTLAALLLTMLMWFGIYALSATENVIMLVRSQAEIRLEETERRIETARNRSLESERETLRSTIQSLEPWLSVVRAVRWPMPKTSETVGLLGSMLSREGDIDLMGLIRGDVVMGAEGRHVRRPAKGAEERAEERARKDAERSSPLFIVGTSLLFELIMLSAAAWIFCRRDF
jgi:ABC-type transport system involved in multi-copper enzyme maturation permease subunit